MKAMLLAAGRGKRLRPVTSLLPKPLLMAGNMSLIEHNLLALKRSGIQEVVINVAYHAKQIMQALGNGDHLGLKITYSYEKQGCLGTAGGVLQALPLLGNGFFVLMSADIWSDFIFPTAFIRHYQSDAHLLLVRHTNAYSTGDYALSDTGRVYLDHTQALTYAGIGLFHARLFKKYHHGAGCSFAVLLEKAIRASDVTGEVYNGTWFNVGTMTNLIQLRAKLAHKK